MINNLNEKNNKIKRFDTLYNVEYPNLLKRMGLDPKAYMITKMVYFNHMAKNKIKTKEDFHNIYFCYISAYLKIDDADYLYESLFNSFCEIMAPDLADFTVDELWECYLEKTMYNFYYGFKFENSVKDLIVSPYRTRYQIDLLDSIYKIDCEFLDTFGNTFGLQLKKISYLNCKKDKIDKHKNQMNKYLNDFDANEVFYVLHDEDKNGEPKPVKLKATNTYLIPFEGIDLYKPTDFIIGSYEELERELNL